MNNNFEHNATLYLSGNMSQSDRDAFEAEIQSSEELRNQFAEYEFVWKLTNQLDYDQVYTQSSWHTFQSKVESTKTISLVRIKIAASILLLAAISISMWFLGSTDVTFTTNDKIEQRLLADESKVKLYRNSHLEWSGNFNKENRTVSLRGQASFDIRKSVLPFVLKTHRGDIIVFGTQFDVYTDEAITTVALKEGSVSFLTDSKEEFRLVPGDVLLYEEGRVTIEKGKNNNAWDDQISCVDMPLAYILGQLKLTYNVDYEVKQRLLKERYTVTLPSDDLKSCLRILNDLVGKNFALIDGRIVLK